MNHAASLTTYRGDPLLLGIGISLLCIGLVAIASASIEYGDFHFGNPWHHTSRHALYLAMGVTAGAVTYMTPTQSLKQFSAWLLFLAFGLLILVLMPGIGREVNGAQRWLPLGPLTFQPSEFVKFALLLYVAGYLVRQEEAVRYQWQGLAKLMGILAIVAVLLLAEPDFGATVITVGMVVGMMFIAGAKLQYIGAMLVTVTLWQKMGDLSDDRPAEFLSTHPAPENRQAALNAMIPSMLKINPDRKKSPIHPVEIVRES